MKELISLPAWEDSLALDLLRRGCLVESYGQVPEEVRARADEFIAESLRTKKEHLEEELVDFVDHCRKSPGRAYKASWETNKKGKHIKANGVEHKLLLLKAMQSPGIRMLWRSDIDTFTQHRYISVLGRSGVERVPRCHGFGKCPFTLYQRMAKSSSFEAQAAFLAFTFIHFTEPRLGRMLAVPEECLCIRRIPWSGAEWGRLATWERCAR